MLSLTLLLAASATGLPDAGAAPAAGTTAADVVAIRAAHVHVGDGSVLENAVIVMQDGVIKSVGKDAPAGVTVTDVDGHVAPGFIALRDWTGTGGEANESTRKLTPSVDLSRAFDPHHPDWANTVAQGITTVLIPPDSSRIAGGLAAIVSPARGEVIKRGAALSLGLSSRSLSSQIEPTSYAGMYAHLRAALQSAAADSPMAMAKAGKLPVMMEAVSRAEVLRAVAFAKENGLKGALIGAPKASDVVAQIKGAGLGVVFEPMSTGGAQDVVKSAIALQLAGVPFAFTSETSTRGPAAMRMTVAACVRGGLDAGDALAALTKNAAELAGVGKTHGTVAAGKAADLVVWSGDPTDLTSRIHAVYAAGELVHHGHGDR